MTTEKREIEKRKSNFETRLNTNVFCCDDLPGDNFIAVGIKAPQASTIQIDKCEKIVLRQSGIDVKFELNNDNIRKFKQIYINGIGFVRSEAFCEELEDRLPKDIKFQVMEIIQDLLEDWKQ
jgi:hypothetical protein